MNRDASSRALDAVVRTPSGAHVLDLPADIRTWDVHDLLRAAHARGFGNIEIIQDGASATITGPPPAPISPKGEVLLMIRENGWWVEWLTSKNDAEKSTGTSRLSDIPKRMRRLFDSSWAAAPCALTVATSDDTSFSRIVEAVFAYFEVRRCRREFSFGQLRENRYHLARYEDATWSAQGQPLSLRVPQLPALVLPEVGVREERNVVIGGVTERWRIVWRNTPEPVCSPDTSFNCPCVSFWFGEGGDADVVRSRPGQADDVLPLNEVFGSAALDMPGRRPNDVVLRRWPIQDGDYEHQTPDREVVWRRVRTRPLVTLMDLRDYNRDGWAAEFELPVGGVGCAARYSVVIGITPRRRELHAFASVANPESPLMLGGEWSKLLNARGKIRYTRFPCGFRGGETRVEVEVYTDARGIHAASYEYACDGTRRQGLLSREVF